MFGALKRGRFRSLASLILVVNVVVELQRKRTLAASRGFLAAARLSCIYLLHVPIHARLQIFIQLSQTLTKLCHIKCDYLVHVICSKCPPLAEKHAFRRLRKSLIALVIVTCGKSSQICCFYNVNKHAGCDMTSTVTSFAQ